MRRHYVRVMWGTVLVAALAMPSALEAQQRGQRGGPPGGRAELEQRVRHRFAQMVQEQLGLTEVEAQRLGETTRGFMDRRRELMQDEEATRRRVEALVLEGGGDGNEARQLVARLIELREEEVALFRDEQEALLDVLSPYQLLQFHQIRERMNERVRALRGRGGGPGGSPGGPAVLELQAGPRGSG